MEGRGGSERDLGLVLGLDSFESCGGEVEAESNNASMDCVCQECGSTCIFGCDDFHHLKNHGTDRNGTQ